LIADHFPAGQLATATSIYTSGVYVGTAAASLSALLNAALGWRASFLALAAAGLALSAAAAALVSEPRDAAQPAPPGHARAGAGASAAEAGHSIVGESVRSARAVLAAPGVPLVLAATAARFAAGYSIGGRAGAPRPAPARRRQSVTSAGARGGGRRCVERAAAARALPGAPGGIRSAQRRGGRGRWLPLLPRGRRARRPALEVSAPPPRLWEKGRDG
jgi:hypothetical protein